MNTATIDGPLGPFLIPDTCERTRKHCEALSRQVFEGEYLSPELPTDVRTVLDIGAGWGAFTVWSLAKWPNACIKAYEPHKEAADAFVLNLQPIVGGVGDITILAGIGRVATYMHRAAVTTDPAPRLNGCEDWGSYHTHNVLGGWPVPAVHPRDLPPCDIMKCDAEGVEVEVLEYYQHLSKCQALLVEYHGLDKREGVFRLAGAAGFRCVKAPGESTDYGPTVWVR